MAEERAGDEKSTPNGAEKGELDSILNALEEDPSGKFEPDADEESGKEPGKKAGGEKGGEQIFKQIGDHTFKTEAEYDAWALRNNGEVSRLTGELAKAKENKAGENPKLTERQESSDNVYWQVKAKDFFMDNPDAANYREEMAVFLKKGAANDDKGRPSLQKAYEMSLRALGKEIPSEKVSDNKTKVDLFKSGGDRGGSEHVEDYNPYQSQEDLDDITGFAKRVTKKK
jgi:hypothetical protein